MNQNGAHPGLLLKKMLPKEMSQREAAKRLKVVPSHLHDLLSGRRAVSIAMAFRLADTVGKTADWWARKQLEHDLAEYRRANP